LKKLLIVIPVVGLILVSIFIPAHAAAPGNAWWDADYLYRQKITVSSSGSTAVPDEYSVGFIEDTASLISAGRLRPDGNDWRITYWNGSHWIELDRHVRSGWDSADTETWFKTQAAISGGASDDNYYVYYGHSAETGTPPSYWSDSMGADAPSRVYWYADDFEEHAIGDDPDGWTDQGEEGFEEDFYVALHGSEKWFQVNTWNDWRRGSTASSMANIGDAVWSARIYFHHDSLEYDNEWGGIGVHVDNENIGTYVVIRDGGWDRASEPDWVPTTSWQPFTPIHFPLGSKGRIELITHGTYLDAYWYNPPGDSSDKVPVFTDFTIPSGTGKLDVHVERPGGDPFNTRWLDADDIIVRKYVNPEPTVSLGAEENRPPMTVGGEVYPVDKAAVLIPWLSLALLLALAGAYAARLSFSKLK